MSNYIDCNEVLLLGAGRMARHYTKVLNALGKEFTVLGNSPKGAEEFTKDTGVAAYCGGADRLLHDLSSLPKLAINASTARTLFDTNMKLLQSGIKTILTEKPGAQTSYEMQQLACCAKEKNAQIYVGYNRRYYASVLAARDIIEQDGGVRSFNFEFTELPQVIQPVSGDISYRFYSNSTHVIDLAFYLGGVPEKMCCHILDHQGKYLTATNFSGSGKSKAGALFSYHANYLAPGRWCVEMLTNDHRLILRPLEKLQLQNIGSMEVYQAPSIDYSLDEAYKPGLYRQVSAFLEGHDPSLLSLQEHLKMMALYDKIHTGLSPDTN